MDVQLEEFGQVGQEGKGGIAVRKRCGGSNKYRIIDTGRSGQLVCEE